MTHIRSALEIALEKTGEIKGDKAALAAAKGKEEGQKLASNFFQDPGMDLAGALKNIPKEKFPLVKEGFCQVILANLILPRDEEDLKKFDPIAAALEVLTGDKAQIKEFASQLSQFFRQWLESKKQQDEDIRQQLGPLLRQKEAQLSQQLGRPVRIDPRNDPDYMKAYNRKMGDLENQYGSALAQAKEDLAAMLAESR
jgi:hypothetical protein